ncbi:hypothetical protein SB767_29270, partial [Bacillus sp. SIMBA_069]
MRSSHLRNLLAALLATALLGVGAPVAAASAAPAAQLSVTLESNEKTVTSGETLTYTGTVENLGDASAPVKIVLE